MSYHPNSANDLQIAGDHDMLAAVIENLNIPCMCCQTLTGCRLVLWLNESHLKVY